ncbi:MAG: hypothetical protein ACR2N2_07065 [Acidimicrobiia bacterium]
MVTLIVVLVTRQTEQRGTVEFYAAADEASTLHADASDTLNSTLAQIGPLLSRQEVTTRLALVTETATEADLLLDLEVPPSVGNAYGSIDAASTSWVDGATEVQQVVIAIMDGELVTAAEVELEAALDKLRVGDVGYEQFRTAAAIAAEDLTLPAFGPVWYINPAPADPLLYDAQNLVLRIQAAYNLAPRRNVGVIGSTVPEPVGDRGGIPLVPFSEAIGVNAVVTNLGNEDETDVGVSLDVLNIDTGQGFADLTSIESLTAGASTTVMFDNLDLTPGGLYQVTVSVTIEEDNDPLNNVWSMTFIWNEES